jgi:hypothetical protein
MLEMTPAAFVASRLFGIGRRSLHLMALALLVSAPAVAPAIADQHPVGTAAKKQAKALPGPVLAVVSLSKQRIHIYGSTGLVAESPISSGMAGFRTPPGVFTVLEKRRFHHSNIYSGAPMPYMQRLTWSGIALHGGVVPGYPASHGCVRLPHKFAAEAWSLTTLGTRVVVAPDDPVPAPIEHVRLPTPRFLPAPPDIVAALAEKGPEVAAAAAITLTDAGRRPPSPKLLNPVERARAMRGFYAKDAAEKTRTAKLAVESAAARAADARSASAALRAEEDALASARRRHEHAAKAAEQASAKAAEVAAAAAASAAEQAKTGLPPHSDKAVVTAATAAERAMEALVAAKAALASAERRTEEASLLKAVAMERSVAAEAVVIETGHARREAATALKLSERADAPISILVSRKAGKVFVRQAWIPIHEAPVTFTDAGPALGTHVYLAVGPVAGGETMSWLSVSLPAPAPQQPRRHRRKAAQAAPAAAPPTETAMSVLARFELPAATKRFIEERLWTGATLIVSDHSTSRNETNLHTDFVVLPR